MTYQAVLAALVGGNGLSKSDGTTVRKLTDSDKREILKLYRLPGETTSTLAERYDVSNSTISRLLKSTLPEEVYEELIQQKRAARTPERGKTSKESPAFEETRKPISAPQPQEGPNPATSPVVINLEQSPEAAELPLSKRTRRRSSAPLQPETEVQSGPRLKPVVSPIPPASQGQLELFDTPNSGSPSRSIPNRQNFGDNLRSQPQIIDKSIAASSSSPLSDDVDEEANAIAHLLGEDLLDESEDLTDLDDEDEDLDDLDEDDIDDDAPILRRQMLPEAVVQVLPLSEAALPKICYLVIDRASELITRPLRDFGDLGEIPTTEVQQKTLPVFDNHRVARRFSTKRDRVIKIPDSKLLQKARSHLQAKGITRLLVDGHVYSLSLT
jgi:transposase-like protein